VTGPDLRFPVGPFRLEGDITDDRRAGWLAEIAALPAQLRAAVAGLDDEQLATPYRPGGWTVRQVIHHVPDSHLNAYVRCKLALTEDEPTVKPYDEARWAELADVRETPIELSMTMLDALHGRWVRLLRSLGPAELGRRFVHPEHGKAFTVDWVIPHYAWHGRHHLAHITSLRERNGWT
jgi:hypothetical protein